MTILIEQQVTMNIRLLAELQQPLHAASRQDGAVIDKMSQPIDPEELYQRVRQQLHRAEGSQSGTAP